MIKNFLKGLIVGNVVYRFELEKEHLIEFTQVAIRKAPTSEKILNRVMPKDNIALCAVFKIKENVYANRLYIRVFFQQYTQ